MGPSNTWQVVGRSETIRNTSNPVFTKDFTLDFYFEREQLYMVRVFDDDFGASQDDFLGEAVFKLGTVMGSRGQVLLCDLTNSRLLRRTSTAVTKAKVILRAMALSSEANNVLHFTLQGRNMDKKDGIFFKSDPFFEVSVKNGINHHLLYRSEYVYQNLNPKWKPCQIPMNKLGSGPIRFTVTDWDSNGSHDLIGICEVTLNDLVSLKKSIPLIHPPTKSKYTKASYVNSGLLDVVDCRVDRHYSFVDFLRGGLAMQLMVAIDFTASNGDPNLPGTKHYYGGPGTRNNYLDAISAVGNICLEYDADKMIQAFGFGAKRTPYDREVSHCFPLLSSNVEFVHGIDGVLAAYTSCFQQGIVLYGPTCFAPVISRCTRIAMESPASSSSSYFTLLIVTDGEIVDMQDTIDAIVFAARNAPLSIIITGVGNASFASMHQLDGDVVPLTNSKGERCCRDIVQFVPFESFRNPSDLASETLREVPMQVTEYFRMRNIAPNPPIEVEIFSVPAAQVVPPPPVSIGKQLFNGAIAF